MRLTPQVQASLSSKDCKNVEGAWEYIKWFTSTDTMITYGQNVEGVMGPLGRFESANVEVSPEAQLVQV